jgi:Ion transport protein
LHQSVHGIRSFCGRIVEDHRVQTGIIALVLINSVLAGLGTFDFVTDDRNVEQAFKLADQVFLVVFTVEIGLQAVYRCFSLFLDPFLVFDVVIILVSWSVEGLTVARAFRVFRALRLLTRLESLRQIMIALGDVMPRLYTIAMLLVLVFYIYSILFVELFRDITLDEDYFTSLPASFFTCIQLMTLGM